MAPIQTVNVPRLELMGASLGNKLAQSVSNVFDIRKEHMTEFLDRSHECSVVDHRDFKPFVSNRIGEIQMSTCPAFRRLHSCNCVTMVSSNLVEDDNCRLSPERDSD